MLENAKLVRLKISQFGNTRQDDGITAEVKQEKHLGQGAGKWVKAKLPPLFLEPARKGAGVIRSWHYSLTCPWDEGLRLLADKTLERYRAELAEHQGRFAENVGEIDYTAAIEEARKIHNGTFDPKDYPTAEDFRRSFAVTAEFMPVPRGQQLIVKGMADDALQEMRADLERRNEDRIAAAHANTWARLLEPVQAIAAKLSNPDAKVYRDSLVENIADICARVDALNITGDHQLTEAARIIQRDLSRLNLEDLKSSEVQRRDVAQRAEAILKQFGAMGSRKFAQESEAA